MMIYWMSKQKYSCLLKRKMQNKEQKMKNIQILNICRLPIINLDFET